ncbi:MAG: antibiotic biosynthesis monooxygenase [Chloroflexota bacterium]
MITVMAKVTARPGREEELRAMFEAQVEHVRDLEPRTVSYAIFRDAADPLTFYFLEQYEDEAARAAHSAAPYIRADIARLDDLTTDGVLWDVEVVGAMRR